MIAGRLRRVRTMGRDEILFRARAVARTQVERLTAMAAAPVWRWSDLRRVLSPHVVDGAVERAIRRADWSAAHLGIARTLRERPSRFVIDPGGAWVLRDEILRRWPGAAVHAAARADRILAGEYDLLGYRGLRFTTAAGAIDWHVDPVSGRRAPRRFWADVRYLDPSAGDHKVIWELNRHQHWLALGRAFWLTGDRRYARGILAELDSWLRDNPPRVGINWSSMLEVAFRSLSWLWALHLLLADRAAHEGRAIDEEDESWLPRLLVAMHHQMEHVSRNLSCYFSPNTHLLGEALALYVVGLALPEMARSARWIDTGRHILLQEIDRQIARDGGHAERSLHYHRYTLDFYLLGTLVAARCGDDGAAAAFGEAAARMAAFLREMATDDGRAPQLGDDDGGSVWPFLGRDPRDVRDSLAVAATVLDCPAFAPWGPCEETFWLAWSAHPDRLQGPTRAHAAAMPRESSPHTANPLDSRGADEPAAEGLAFAREGGTARVTVFAETGYIAMRDGTGGHLVFDVGPHGYRNGGHAHADALSITLALSGTPFLIDPGTGSYTDGQLRDRLRSTASHNTLTVDGRSSSEPAGRFHWRSHADARLHGYRSNAKTAWAEGSHDGYPGLRHRRSVVRTADGWLIVDELLGAGNHEGCLHWHIDPSWTVAARAPRAVEAWHPAGTRAWIVHDAGERLLARGEESGLGWCSPVYGTVVPTWTARLRRAGALPIVLATWVRPAQPGEAVPAIERLEAECETGGTIVAVRLACAEATAIAMLRPGDQAACDLRRSRAGGYRTDARLLQHRRAGGREQALTILDATHALALEEGLLAVTTDRPVADLHVAVVEDRLELSASAPPGRLLLRGGGVERTRVLLLNGRPRAVPPRMPGGALVLTAGDWPEPVSGSRASVCVA